MYIINSVTFTTKRCVSIYVDVCGEDLHEATNWDIWCPGEVNYDMEYFSTFWLFWSYLIAFFMYDA